MKVVQCPCTRDLRASSEVKRQSSRSRSQVWRARILLLWSSVMELADLRTVSDSVGFKDQLKTFLYKISFVIQ